ncbi:hypothetical protein [Streptomyces anulatus]|uniref:hypothetical protein n=1 Tax=Streptomyces anulatus TaxID=1892 RepID=UPI00356B778A
MRGEYRRFLSAQLLHHLPNPSDMARIPPVSSVFNPVASGALLYVVVSRFEMGKNVAALVAGVIVTPVSFLLARWAFNSGRPTTNATGIDPNAPAEAKRDTPTLGRHQLAGR